MLGFFGILENYSKALGFIDIVNSIRVYYNF